MTVRVSWVQAFADLAQGQPGLAASGRTVGEVLAQVAQAHPRLGALLWPQGRGGAGEPRGALNPVVVLFLNGQQVRGPEALAASVRDGDELMLVSAVEGG
ncbi:MAG TPA: MoaD/ThiS family protein [bacterium]|nr:MoaD/ThiS family protein [bacterium]